MKTMFEVEISKEDHSWYRFVFKFETLDEAQQFVKDALTHFYKDEDDEDMIIKLRYVQKFSTANGEKEKEGEDNDEEEN